MNTLLWIAIVLAYAALLVWLGWKIRFRKPKPEFPLVPEHTVTTTCQPGATTLRMVDENGNVRAVLLLTNITWGGHAGVSAEFVDRTRFLMDRML